MRISALRQFLGLLTVFCSMGLSDAPSAAGVDEPRASRPLEGSFSGSIANLQDRAAEQVLQDARRAADAGDWVSGVRRLQELLIRGEESLLVIDGVYRPADDVAALLLRSGSPSLQSAYERVYGPPAREELEKALAGDNPIALQRVAMHYRFTDAGRSAGLSLAVLNWDRGDRIAAAGWWRFTAEWSPGERSADRPTSPYAAIARFADELDRSVEHAADDDMTDAPTPEAAVRWSLDVPMSEGARREISESLAELNAQAIMPLMPARPLVRGDAVIWRQMERIVAVHRRTGEVLWEYAVPTPISNLIREERDFSNTIRRSSSTAIFLERLVRSSLLDRITTDGARLFAVLPDPSPRAANAPDANGPPPPVPRNEIVALVIDDGRLLWRTGPREGWARRAQDVDARPGAEGVQVELPMLQPGDELTEVFFMGPPEPFERWRLVVAQYGAVVLLLALDEEDGALAWSVPLGRAARSLWEDRPRHGVACPVLIRGGKAYCPTAAGCLACVDLLTRRLVWAYRYPRDDLPRHVDSPDRFRPDAMHASNLPTREQWHEVFVHAGEETIVFAAPDVDRIFGLDSRTGDMRWALPRAHGLFAVGVDDERVLIVSGAEATARRISDGATLWNARISPPAGTGFLTPTEYVFPTESSGLQRVRLADGALEVQFAAADGQSRVTLDGRMYSIANGPPARLQRAPMRNLVVADGELLVQSFDRLSGVPVGESMVTESWAALAASESIQEGNGEADPSSPKKWWSWQGDSFARGPELRIARAVSRLLGVAESISAAGQHLIPRMRAADVRAAQLLSELAAALKAGSGGTDGSETFDDVLDRLLRLPLHQLYVSFHHPRRWVRLDLWLGHDFVELATADPSVQAQLRERLFGQRQEVDSQPAGGEAPLDSTDVAMAALSGPFWPQGRPIVTEHPPQGGDLYVLNIPMTVIRDSPWEHVTVQVDRQERNLWFHRADLAAPVQIPWRRSAESPETLGGMIHSWAVGSFLCVRVGSDLAGFRMEGDRLPQRPLWPEEGRTHSLTGDRPPLFMGLAESTDDPVPLWDDSIPDYYDSFWRPLGIIGPVRAGSICYQDRGVLVAVDPATGRERWTRAGLSVGTYCVGDDHRIVLLRDEGATIEVLRSSDGATVSQWAWNRPPDGEAGLFSHVVAVRGTLGLWHSDPPQGRGLDPLLENAGSQPVETTAAIIDLTNGEELWTEALPPDSWVFGIDQSRLGTLTPAGDLTIRNWDGGAVVAEHQIDIPRAMTDLFVMTDATAAYVVASDRPHDKRILGATQIRGARRRPIVNGWMHALSRIDGRHLWGCELANIGLILDQPRHVPLLITAYMMQDGLRDRSAGVLRTYDRRTGELLDTQLRVQPVYLYHAVRADAAQGRVEVDLRDKTIRFQFPAE